MWVGAWVFWGLTSAFPRRILTSARNVQVFLQMREWCRFCHYWVYPGAGWSGHFGGSTCARRRRERKMGRFSERRSATPAGNCTGSYSAAGDDAEHWPVLVEFLNLQKFVDGSPRLTGTLLVFVQDGMLKAM